MSRTWPALDLHFPTHGHTPGLRDRTLAALDDWQPTALSEDETHWRAYFTDASVRDRAAAALRETPGTDGLAIEVVDEPDEDWARRSQAGLEPIQIGTILVRPFVLPAPTPTGNTGAAGSDGATITIVIEPSMGFGTGHHATTRLCLAMLQQIDVRGRRILDVGCGSGILSIAADRLGAASATGLDSDPDAIESARRNLDLNPAARHTLFTLADIRQTQPAPADVLVANLTGAFLIRHADVLLAHLAPGGSCLLSGILTDEAAAVLDAFTALTLVERLQEDEWVGLRLRKI